MARARGSAHDEDQGEHQAAQAAEDYGDSATPPASKLGERSRLLWTHQENRTRNTGAMLRQMLHMPIREVKNIHILAR